MQSVEISGLKEIQKRLEGYPEAMKKARSEFFEEAGREMLSTGRRLIGGQEVALHIPGRDAVVAEHQCGRRGVVDAVARAAALEHLGEEIAAAAQGVDGFIVAELLRQEVPDGRQDIP